MKSILVAIGLMTTTAFADNNAIQTDLKFLCEILKIEKSMQKDKTIDSVDLAERISALKENALRDQSTKDAFKAISSADTNEQGKLWKAFAKDNKFKKAGCF